MSEYFRVQLNELRHSLVPDIIPLEYYNHKKSRLRCSIAWLLSVVFDGRVPLEYEDPLIEDYTDEETSKQIELNPSVAALLTSGHAYRDAARLILKQAPSSDSANVGANGGHAGVLLLLQQCGFYNIPDDGKTSLPKLDTHLALNNPIRASVHQSVIDAFMRAYLVNHFSVERVTSSIRSMVHLSSLEQPRTTEEALLLWISKVCHVVRARLEQERRDRTAQLTRQNGRSTVRLESTSVPVIPVVKDLLADISDGAALATLITHYCPDHLRITDIALKDPLGVADSCFNLEIVRLFSDHLDHSVYFFRLEDLLYMHSSFKPNVLVFLADMFACLCSTPPLLCSCSQTPSTSVALPLGSSREVAPTTTALGEIQSTDNNNNPGVSIGEESVFASTARHSGATANENRQAHSSQLAKSYNQPPTSAVSPLNGSNTTATNQSRLHSETEALMNLRQQQQHNNAIDDNNNYQGSRNRQQGMLLLNGVEFSNDFTVDNDFGGQPQQQSTNSGTVVVVADDELPMEPHLLLPGGDGSTTIPKKLFIKRHDGYTTASLLNDRARYYVSNARRRSHHGTYGDGSSGGTGRHHLSASGWRCPPVLSRCLRYTLRPDGVQVVDEGGNEMSPVSQHQPPLIRRSSAGPAVAASNNSSGGASSSTNGSYNERPLTASSYTVSSRRYPTAESARQAGLPVVDNYGSLVIDDAECDEVSGILMPARQSVSPRSVDGNSSSGGGSVRITWAELQRQQQQQGRQQSLGGRNFSEMFVDNRRSNYDGQSPRVAQPLSAGGQQRSGSVGSLTLKLQMERRRREAEMAKLHSQDTAYNRQQRARDDALRNVLPSDFDDMSSITSPMSLNSTASGTYRIRNQQHPSSGISPEADGYHARLEQLNQSLTDLHSQLRNLSTASTARTLPTATLTMPRSSQQRHHHHHHHSHLEQLPASPPSHHQQPAGVYGNSGVASLALPSPHYHQQPTQPQQPLVIYQSPTGGFIPAAYATTGFAPPGTVVAVEQPQAIVLNSTPQRLVIPSVGETIAATAATTTSGTTIYTHQQPPPQQFSNFETISISSSIAAEEEKHQPLVETPSSSSVHAPESFFVPIGNNGGGSAPPPRIRRQHRKPLKVDDEDQNIGVDDGASFRRSQSLSALANRLAASGSSSSLLATTEKPKSPAPAPTAFVVGDVLAEDELEKRKRQKCLEMELKRKLERSLKKDGGFIEAARQRDEIRQKQDEQEKRRAERRMKQKQVFEEYLQKKKAEEEAALGLDFAKTEATPKKPQLPKSKSRDAISMSAKANSARGGGGTRRLGTVQSEHENLSALADGNGATIRLGKAGRPGAGRSVVDLASDNQSETASTVGTTADLTSVTAKRHNGQATTTTPPPPAQRRLWAIPTVMVSSANIANSNKIDSRTITKNNKSAFSPIRTAKSMSSLKVTPSIPLRVQPSAKSNKTLVYNAIRDTCLAGGANAKQRQDALASLDKSEARHFVILFRDAGCQYRGLYTFEPDAAFIERIHGIGPKTVRNQMVEHFFKYNSGSKRFSAIPTTQHMSVSVDAVSIYQNFWQQRIVHHHHPQQQQQHNQSPKSAAKGVARPPPNG